MDIAKITLFVAGIAVFRGTVWADEGDTVADRIDQRGDRIEDRLDHKGNRVDARLDRRGDRIDDRLDNKGDRETIDWINAQIVPQTRAAIVCLIASTIKATGLIDVWTTRATALIAAWTIKEIVSIVVWIIAATVLVSVTTVVRNESIAAETRLTSGMKKIPGDGAFFV